MTLIIIIIMREGVRDREGEGERERRKDGNNDKLVNT